MVVLAALPLFCSSLVAPAQEVSPAGWHRRSDALVGWVNYCGGMFIGTGYAGVLASSTNGVTWITPDSGTTNELVSPIYAGHQFVCVGMAGTIVTSLDGLTWTRRPSPAGGSLMSVAYGNGVTVTVGGDLLNSVETRIILRSTNDGTDWQVVRQEPGPSLYRVAFGAGQFVALYSSECKLLTSRDGLDWQTNDFQFSTPVSLFYTGTNFFMLGTSLEPDGTRFPHIWTSADALTWRDTRIPIADAGLGCITYGAGAYVATGSIRGQFHWDWIHSIGYQDPDVPLILTSIDGRSWHQETALSPLAYSLAYGHGTFVTPGRVVTNALGIYQTDVLVPRFARQATLTAQGFEGEVVSEPAFGFRVQSSADFASWTDLLEAANPPERTPFTDPIATPAVIGRFYRLLPLVQP